MNFSVKIPVIDLIRFHVSRITAIVHGLIFTMLVTFLSDFTMHVTGIKLLINEHTTAILAHYSNFAGNVVSGYLANPPLVITVSLIFLVPITVFNIVLILVSFIRFSKYYINNTFLLVSRIPLLVKILFSRSSYTSLWTTALNSLSHAMYSLLLYLDEQLDAFLIFRDPWIIVTWYRLVRRRLLFMLNPMIRFANKTFDFINTGGATDDKDDMLNLMDTVTSKASQPHIPELVVSLFKSINICDYEDLIPDTWKKITATIDERMSSKLKTALLVTGTSGSGKSSFLNWFEKNHDNSAILRLNISRHKDHQDTVALQKIIESDEAGTLLKHKSIIIVDDVEYLFTREIDGYQAIQSMMHTIEKTRSTHTWIVTGSHYFISFLKKIIPIHSIFPFQLDPARETGTSMQTLIQHHITTNGYKLLVKPTSQQRNEIAKLVKNKNLGNNEIMPWLTNHYFRTMQGLGGPCLSFHTFYILRSIVGIQGNSIVVQSPDYLDLPVTIPYGMEALFVLQSLFIHKHVDKKMIERSLLMEPGSASMILSMLHDNNIIELEGDFYRINPILYKQTADRLVAANLL
jgi:hypothetical protein